MNRKERLIHLDHCRGIGWKSIGRIMEQDASLKGIYSLTAADWTDLLKIPADRIASFYHDLHTLDIFQTLKQYEENEISCITRFDPAYSSRLSHIYDPPWILYTKGDSDLLNHPAGVGVVGARKPSQYGLEAARGLVAGLVRHDYAIFSGAAAGIDACAHETALRHNGKTAAVLGGGLYYPYPRSNSGLILEISKKGLLISEQPPARKPEPWMFAMRNRIISGLSNGVLVAEAKLKSGSLITAQTALDQGREVFAVPGNITSPLSEGTNRLIQDGASLAAKASDIIEELAQLPGLCSD